MPILYVIPTPTIMDSITLATTRGRKQPESTASTRPQEERWRERILEMQQVVMGQAQAEVSIAVSSPVVPDCDRALTLHRSLG